MFKLFPQLIILIALVAIIVIVARRIPKLAEVKVEEKKPQPESKWRKILQSILNFARKAIAAIKIFSFNLIKRLVSKIKEIREKREVQPEAKKEVKELVKEALPVQKAEVSVTDGIIDLLEKASKMFGAGDFTGAEKAYIEIIKKDPANSRAYKGLGKIYLKQNNLKDARASFEQVLKIKTDDEDAKMEIRVIESKIAR